MALSRWLSLLSLLLLALLFTAGTPSAQTLSEEEQIAAWDQELTAIETQLRDSNNDARAQASQRTQLLAIIQAAQAQAQSETQALEGVEGLLTALGPAPAADAPPEEASIRQEREKLEAEKAAILAKKGRTDLVVAKANLLLTRLDQARLEVFTEQLFSRGPSLLAEATWTGLPAAFASFLQTLERRATPEADADDDRRLRRILLGLGALVVAVAGIPATRWLRRLLDRRRGPVTGPVPYRHRALTALVDTAVRFFVPFMVTLFLLFAALTAFSGYAWAGLVQPLAVAVTTGACLTFLLLAAGRAAITPGLPNWRLLNLAEPSVVRLNRRWTLASIFLGIYLALRILALDLEPDPILLSVLYSAVVLLGAFILIGLLPAKLWYSDSDLLAQDANTTASSETEGESSESSNAWLGQGRYLRLICLLIALLVVVSAVLGYITFSDYVGLLFLVTLGVGAVLLALRSALRDGLHVFLFQNLNQRGDWRRLLYKTERGASFFELLLFILLDVFLILLALPVILPAAGIPEGELQFLVSTVLQGFTIGGVTIKPGNILLAILVFVLILALTRLIQRRLRGRFFTAIGAESSVQQSVSAGIGYVGVIGAMLIGINVLGVDLTNLALIAGALSVGIGFGLQAIVSNFVAGLILLIERPIKVGDWVVVGPNEGVVKRISVRATEIQTWQRSAVLIPNSDLVSTAVVNWTHKDRIGRLDIAVRVPFGTDPKKVHDVLLECANDSKPVLRFPAAYVYFKNFSPDGMDFDIRVYVPDIYELFISVANDVRFAIVERFADAGIEMALPRRILHMADMEPLDLGALAAAKREEATDRSDGEGPEGSTR
ncbi:MAG: DUF3772 domain-containing protein [Pseudomonadota bacterium]